MPWTTPATMIAGQLVTAAFWNTQVRDNELYLFTNLLPAGSIVQFGATTAPAGWLLCDGAAVSRTTYAVLFAAIGTTWGTGDGSTTFNVPDHRGRTPIGQGTGAGLTGRTLAAILGEEIHALTTAEMPAHFHTAAGWNVTAGDQNLHGGTAGQPSTVNTSTVGSGTAHNNMQPSVVVAFIIKT